MSDINVLTALVNPEFTFTFAGKEYQIKKANIKQVQQYFQKVEELSKDKERAQVVKDLEVVSYCLFISLNSVDPSVTEDFVQSNLPGAVDALSLLAVLGFIDPEKVQMVKKLQEKLIMENSSSQ